MWKIQNDTSHFGTARYAVLLKPGVYPQDFWINPGAPTASKLLVEQVTTPASSVSARPQKMSGELRESAWEFERFP